MQHYGLYTRPHPGADYAVSFIGGNREQGIAIASADRRYHLKLFEGEVALADDLGNVIRLGRDKLTITAKTALEITAPAIKITGPVTINGNIATTGTLTNNGKNVGSTHTHAGVTPGSGNSGAPT
jgi:phage gp45-like